MPPQGSGGDGAGRGLLRGRLEDARAWCGTRRWEWRLALLGVLGWDAWRHLSHPDQSGLFGGITFGAHELGHLVFRLFGEFMMVAGGSLFQVLLPLGAGALLLAQRDYFGLSAAGAWLGSSLLDLARYVGDARQFDLDLVGFGEGSRHDWAWLLSRLGLLPQDTRIAATIRACAVVALAVSLVWGLQLCVWMGRARRDGT
jgi:hypothetical protein